jgi:hypothetical protein
MLRTLYIVRSKSQTGKVEVHWRTPDRGKAERLAQSVADKLGKDYEVWIDGEVKSVTTDTTRVDWRPK